MKIDQSNISGTSSSQSAALNPASGQRSSLAAGGGADQAELSGLSRAIQSFQSDRAARVDKLSALVRSGKYEVSPNLVSSAIVGEALSSGAQHANPVAR